MWGKRYRLAEFAICFRPETEYIMENQKEPHMILSVVVMLILLGILRRREDRDGLPYFGTALGLGIADAVLMVMVCFVLPGDEPGHVLKFELIAAFWITPVLLIVWGTSFLRDGWIFRTALAVLITGCIALMVWLQHGHAAWQAELSRTDADLLRCGRLVKAGKRAELRAFLERNGTDIGGDWRKWNDAFEAAFPPEGGQK
jgi:hypothetical protein